MGLLGLFLQGSSGGHMLLVEHTRCAEHGELVHGSEAHAHRSHAPSAAEGSATVEAHEAGADDSHEHCLLCADRRATAAASAGSVVIDIRTRDAAPGLRTVHELAGPPQHRIAPKNSPPA
jgi:hypothetical protein